MVWIRNTNLFPESDSLENFKSLYLRPMGVSAEYMVTDDIGVGIDLFTTGKVIQQLIQIILTEWET